MCLYRDLKDGDTAGVYSRELRGFTGSPVGGCWRLRCSGFGSKREAVSRGGRNAKDEAYEGERIG
jgi:hypothetical protein